MPVELQNLHYIISCLLTLDDSTLLIIIIIIIAVLMFAILIYQEVHQ